MSCQHVERLTDAVQVLSAMPRGAHYVHCPCCRQHGWQTDDDPTQMVCPDCLVDACPGEAP